jgi:hypothetical protein
MQLLTATVIILALIANAQAANVYCTIGTEAGGICVRAMLRGTIVEGDYAKARAMVSKFGVTSFELSSPGGDVDEAIKIGRLFRKHLITTTSSYFDRRAIFYLTAVAQWQNASARALVR